MDNQPYTHTQNSVLIMVYVVMQTLFAKKVKLLIP